METIQPFSDLLQMISFIATIAITIIGAIGLRQLTITKDTLKIQSTRDARKISASYVYLYLDRIMAHKDVRVSHEMNETLKNFHFAADDEDYIDLSKISLSIPGLKNATKKQRREYTRTLEAAAAPYFGLLNELEAFSSVVTSGVLDEHTLYRAVGQHFVNTVDNKHLDQFLHYYTHKKNLYTNITEIYDLWSMRITVAKLEDVEMENQKMTNKIAMMKEKIGKAKEQTIETIGAE